MVRPKFETMSSIEDDIERIKEELSRQKEKQKMGTLTLYHIILNRA